MTRRASINQEDLRRYAKVARDERVAFSVELPDGTKLTFGTGADAPASNPLDRLLTPGA